MNLQPGQRIELVSKFDDLHPIAIGTRGTVVSLRRVGTGKDAFVQVDMAWDNGRTLMLSVPPDQYRMIVD